MQKGSKELGKKNEGKGLSYYTKMHAKNSKGKAEKICKKSSKQLGKSMPKK